MLDHVVHRAALLAPGDPANRYNRAVMHQAAAQWDNALADLLAATE